MKKFLGFFVSRWFLSLIGVLILAALIWFFAPFIAPLAGRIIRLILILVVLVVWLAVNLLLDARNRKRESSLTQGVAAAPEASAASEELAALKEKLKTSLALLKKASGSRGYLYEQPWYVIIGPPGAGKTTALLNAGLKFPLAAELGQGAIAGVGGTRLCDWWFTEDAVLIDTAGRYTTQDSDATVDKSAWEGFLDLLKRTRQRQALNGVLVAISVQDIAAAPREDRLAHARAIRKRIKELTSRLGLKLPVYALITKADLIVGFTQYFDDLDSESRAQVWGMTFPADALAPLSKFGDEFKLLLQRLDARMLQLLQRERSAENRAQITGFPAQVGSLQGPLAEFLVEAFGGSNLDPAPWLRGVYFTSGTQEGTPIDRLTGALARTFGIDQRRAPALRPASGRSYFLAKLLRDVVFREAMLASQGPAQRRRNLIIRTTGFAAIGFVFLIVAGGLLLSRANNATAIAATNLAVAQYGGVAQSLPLSTVSDANLLPILPLLDAARMMPFGPGDTARHGFMGLGLNQSGKLATGAAALYVNALDNAMLPRLLLQLEAELRGNPTNPEFLYQATRVYLMLGGQGPLDKSLVEGWMALDWPRLYPGIEQQPARDDMMQHLNALLSAPLPQVSLNWDLVAQARAEFANVPPAERVYSRIRDSQQAAEIPPWIPADAIGGAGLNLFTRASGKPLSEGIPGFYTNAGFHLVLLPALTHAASDVAGESWVLGKDYQIDPASPQMQNLEQDVIALYEKDYEAQWDDLIHDLTLAPAGDLGQANQNLYLLGSPQSPLQKLLTAMVTQLQLSKPLPGAPAGGGGASGLASVSVPAQDAAALQGVLGATPGSAPPAPGAEVDAYYQPLITYVGNGTSSPMTLTLQLINQLQQQIAALAATAPGTGGAAAPVSGGDADSLLQGEAANDPAPVNAVVQSVVANTDSLRGGSAATGLKAAFHGAGGPGQLCAEAVPGRYPFDQAASADIPLGDFTQLFAPGGKIDSFFTQQIQPFVDTSQATWRVQPVNGVAPPIDQGALESFQRAETIKQLFFETGGTPAVQFNITPQSLDAGAAEAVLQLGGLNISYAHGPPVPTQISWPGSDGMETARLIITPVGGGAPVELDASGPWALFRLFGQGQLAEGSSSDQYTLSFSQGGHSVSYAVSAGSVLNPLAPGVLADFSCPEL